jgi:uncharacterized protein (DUF1697 family)
VQSGNVVFNAAERNMGKLAGRLENAIEGRFGFRPRVVLRTAGEMKDVVANDPFAGRPDIAPGKLLVLFLAGAADPEGSARLLAIQSEPEELRLSGRELYAYYPNGIGRAKMSPALIEKALKTPATGRNWNTVTKLLAIAERLEAGRP